MNSPPDDAPDAMDAAAAGGPGEAPPGENASDDSAAEADTPPARPRRPLFRRRPKEEEPPPEAPEGGVLPPADTAEADGDQPTEAVELPPQPPLNPGRMRRERRRLVSRRQETVYHLGGLAFELFRRDMLTEPVMCRRAEEVADIDRAVIAIDEELLTLEETRRARREERRAERRDARTRQKQPAGYCLSCGTPFGDTENFCANCGSPITRPLPEDADDQGTAVVEAEVGSGSTEVIPAPPAGEDSRP